MLELVTQMRRERETDTVRGREGKREEKTRRATQGGSKERWVAFLIVCIDSLGGWRRTDIERGLG